jgi:hypothetical protein
MSAKRYLPVNRTRRRRKGGQARLAAAAPAAAAAENQGNRAFERFLEHINGQIDLLAI